MSWQQLQAEGKVRNHQTSIREITDLRAVVERDLEDAEVDQISVDRRYATAYNAVLQVSKIVIGCAGYRVVGQGHHMTTFQAVRLAMGTQVDTLAIYFDTCRRKRNTVDYDMAGVTTETELAELIKEAEVFHKMVEAWIALNHAQYALPKK